MLIHEVIRPGCAMLAVTLLLLLPRGVARSDDSTADPLWDSAADRIAEHRQADCTIVVRDAAGNPVPQAIVSVRQTRHAFLLGCNIFKWSGVRDAAHQQAYRDQYAELFNFATLPFYWWSYERAEGVPAHEDREQVARWCAANGITCKGHPLAWNYAEPRWLPEENASIQRLQLARIEDCVQRFEDSVDIWDVVNEATHFEREEFQRRSPKLTRMWQDAGRIEFTRECFQRARKANPEAMLLINDYRVDSAYEKLIEQLVDDQGQRLYDAIGIQSHQHGGTWDNQKIWDVCERFSRFGVPLHFTETTVLSGRRGWELAQKEGVAWTTSQQGEREQAEEVERFYTMVFSHPAVEAITWWDFSDLHAWQRAPAGLVRADMTPKPAYETLQRIFKQEWWTNEDLRTDARGHACLRAMLGSYRVAVESDGRSAKAAEFLVRKGEDNVLEIRLP